MKIIYPDKFTEKTIIQEVDCSKPDKVIIVAPTIITVNKPFVLKIALTDIHGTPVTDYNGEIKIQQLECGIDISAPFTKGKLAAAQVHGVQIARDGIFRFEAKFNDETFFSNPCVCDIQERPQIFWGDPHIHTALSDCSPELCRSLNFCFNTARNISCLDWASAADHISNGRCEFARWKEQVNSSNAYNDPPEFVTLPAYEASLKGGSGGDNNFYFDKFPSMFVDEYENGNVKTLCDKLSEMAKDKGFSFFAVPHHTTRVGKHGEIPDEIYPGDACMPVMEIHSKWGSSEYRGNPMQLQKVHPGPSYAVDMLNRGIPFGFIGGTDTHASMTFGSSKYEHSIIDRPPGLTAVICDKLDRDNVFNAIRNKSCYAACSERIFMDFNINGIIMGQSIKFKNNENPKRKIRLICAGKTNIKSIEIIRNGDVLKRFEPNFWKAEVELVDSDELNKISLDSAKCSFVYYYARVRCTSGATAWSSPIRWECETTALE